MEGVREKKTKEEANQLAEQVCMLMMAIIEQNLGVSCGRRLGIIVGYPTNPPSDVDHH